MICKGLNFDIQLCQILLTIIASTDDVVKWNNIIVIEIEDSYYLFGLLTFT